MSCVLLSVGFPLCMPRVIKFISDSDILAKASPHQKKGNYTTLPRLQPEKKRKNDEESFLRKTNIAVHVHPVDGAMVGRLKVQDGLKNNDRHYQCHAKK